MLQTTIKKKETKKNLSQRVLIFLIIAEAAANLFCKKKYKIEKKRKYLHKQQISNRKKTSNQEIEFNVTDF